MKHLVGMGTVSAVISCIEFRFCYRHAMCSDSQDFDIHGVCFRSWAQGALNKKSEGLPDAKHSLLLYTVPSVLPFDLHLCQSGQAVDSCCTKVESLMSMGSYGVTHRLVHGPIVVC